MLQIIDKTKKQPTTITLNEIPKGQVFRGTILEPTRVTTGVFLKFANGMSSTPEIDGASSISAEVLVVGLDTDRCVIRCCVVRDYEPLTATLTVTD